MKKPVLKKSDKREKLLRRIDKTEGVIIGVSIKSSSLGRVTHCQNLHLRGKMEILKTNKDDCCFSIDNFIYKCDKKVFMSDGGEIKYYCHCDQFIDGCRGRAIVQIFEDGKKIQRVTREHDGHAGRLRDLEEIRFRSDLKTKARAAPEKSSREVFDEVFTSVVSQTEPNLVDELVSALSDFVKMKSSIQRARMGGCPPLPQSLDQVRVDGEWANTHDGNRFLLFETDGSDKILGFATDKMLKCLCQSFMVIMDGTFRVSPSLFTHSYTLFTANIEEEFSILCNCWFQTSKERPLRRPLD